VINLPQQAIYGENERSDVRPLLPTDAKSALDVGCGAGGFGITLRRALGDSARIIGVEAVPHQATIAREGHGFDEVLEGYFPDVLACRSDTFDLITFNDVLEHMLDPEGVLQKTRRLLQPSGRVVAIIPNVQYVAVVLRLLGGRWDYSDTGILDRTHVRFFTRKTMMEMFDRAGYRVESCVGANGFDKFWRTDPSIHRRFAKLALRLALRDSRHVHFIIVASIK